MATVRVWPANRVSVAVFQNLTTQWRFSPMGAATGIDYGVLPAVLDLLEVPTKARRLVFSDIGVMEDAALAYFQERRAAAGKQ